MASTHYSFVISLILSFATVILSRRNPTISYISREYVTNIGGIVTLECPVQFAQGDNIQWKKIDSVAPYDSVIIFNRRSLVSPNNRYSLICYSANNKYTLQIKDIQESDAGIYQCEVIKTRTNIITATVQVLVRTPPIISDNSTRSRIASEGENMTLECYATGFPTPKVYWERENNATLPSGESIYTGNILHFPRVSKKYRGVYYCVADNGVGRSTKRNINVKVEFAPVVTVTRPRVGQALQYDADLECYVKGYPPPSVIWLKDNVILTNNQHQKVNTYPEADEYTVSTLRILTVEKRQYGIYICKAVNKLGENSDRIELFETVVPVCPPACNYTEFSAPPVITDNSTPSQIASEGDSITLVCYATGFPPPKVYWIRENNATLPSGGAIYVGNILNFPYVSKKDSGVYYCTAENGVGDGARINISVEVEFAPVVITTRLRVGEALHYNAHLECRVEGYPTPSVIWVKDNVILTNSQHMMVTAYSVADKYIVSTLRILSIKKIHYGIYICKAVNKLGENSKRIQLFETIDPVCPPACPYTEISAPPVITDNSTQSRIAIEGENMTLECYATGYPTPVVYWIRDNYAELPSGGAIYKGNILNFPKVSKKDRGAYYCIAQNGVGEGAWRNISVEVEFAPIVTTTRPRVGQALQYDADLECHVEGNPTPSVIWLKDSVILTNGQHQMYLNSTLRILSIEKIYYGIYICKAANKLGENSERVELFETYVPVCPPACNNSQYSFFGSSINPRTFRYGFLLSSLIIDMFL